MRNGSPAVKRLMSCQQIQNKHLSSKIKNISQINEIFLLHFHCRRFIKMVLIAEIIMKNCRLCHTKPGLYDIKNDKKLLKDIYECVKVKINDKCMNFLPHSVCEECKKTIKCFSLYKQHIRKVDQCLRKILKSYETENLEEHYKCEQCPGEFNSKDVFNKHLNSHLTNSALKGENIVIKTTCPVCKENFDNLDEYSSHRCSTNFKEEVDDNDNSEYQNEYNTLNKDRDEEKVKTEDRKTIKYICKWNNCKKMLSSAYSLKTHELKHQGKRSFLCVTCGKGFITKNSLTCHEKIHLEIKGYICKLCNIGFSVRSNLRAHEKKHHEGVRFYCSQCTKAFASKCSLERHERIHTGIRDFKCQSCPSAFYTKKELLKHQRYHQVGANHS